jgi:hypothetical protein
MSGSDILAKAKASRVREFKVDGESYHVRKLSGAERIDIGTRTRAGQPFSVHEYVALGICDAGGDPLFTVEQAQELSDADGWLAEKMAEEVLRSARLLVGDDPAKNSEATPSA